MTFNRIAYYSCATVSALIVALLLAIYLTPVKSKSISASGNIESVRDVKCKAMTIYHEARGEGYKGMRMVLDVLENRMDRSGRSACQVMTRKSQFSFYYPTMPIRATRKMMQNYNVVKRMDRILPDNVYHYHATYVNPYWAKKGHLVAVAKNHLFYENIR